MRCDQPGAGGGAGATGRSDQISHAFLDAELRQLSAMVKVLPPIFLLVAAMLVNMTLSRLITLEREQIGLLKAIGYASRAVAQHYVEFVVLIAVAEDGKASAVVSVTPDLAARHSAVDLVRVASAALGGKGGGEFGGAESGVGFPFQRGTEREHLGQGGVEFTHNAVEVGLRDGICGDQRDIGIGKSDGPGAKGFHGCDGGGDRFGPAGGGDAKADDAVRPARNAGGEACRNDAGAGAVGIGRAGIKTRAGVVQHKAQGERGQHGAGG